MMVVMALVTTMSTTPILNLLKVGNDDSSLVREKAEVSA